MEPLPDTDTCSVGTTLLEVVEDKAAGAAEASCTSEVLWPGRKSREDERPCELERAAYDGVGRTGNE